MINTLGGTTLIGAYTATQYAAGSLPKLGTVYIDEPNQKRYIFLKNDGATSILASEIATALTTDTTNFYCRIPTAVLTNNFAGVRPVGATALAQNEYGWFQISGAATLKSDAGNTIAAEGGLVSSDATAGTVEAMPNTGIGALAAFAIAQTVAATATTFLASIFKNIWGA